MAYFNYDGQKIEYEIIKKRKKTITLRITKKGEVVVTAPFYVDDGYIEDFVKSKAKWIVEKLKHVNDLLNIRDDNIKTGKELDFIGQKLILKISEDNVDKIKIFKQDKLLYIIVPKNFNIEKDQEVLRQKVNNWLKEQAKVVLKQRVEVYSQRYNLFPNKVVVKEQKTIWGSCSSKGNINLNWKLIMVPLDVIDYVVVHELCHLKHHNHSSRFWSLVKEIMPDFEEKRRWLKENGGRVIIK